ncbi:MAG TPA: hypothetical protein VK929_02405 [Longimicrobiales bacterium]|nr:hypothetical protein [Longimicrobiales bacterium]
MRRLMTVATLLVFGTAAGVHAQTAVELEIRGGASFPTEDFGPSSLKTGGGFEGSVGVLLMPHLKVYGGWGWNQLRTDTPFLGGQYDVETTGYVFGGQFQHPMFDRFGGWIRAGGLYQHIELEEREGSFAADSGHELGWEAGGGFLVQMGERFVLTPGVRYRTLSADLTSGSQTVPVTLSYVAVDIGVVMAFGRRPLLTAAR